VTGPLRVERDGGVAILTFDRPDVLNAFDEALTAALAVAVTDAARDPDVRCVAITGAGRAFSAGQDLRDRGTALSHGAELRLGDELRRRYHPIVTAIREMRKPVIAAVNGIAAGAGLGLATACDVRVAARSATFRAAWSKVGLVPDAASAYFLPRLGGLGRAMINALMRQPELSFVELFEAGVEPENTASRRCLEAAGFRLRSGQPDCEGMLYYGAEPAASERRV